MVDMTALKELQHVKFNGRQCKRCKKYKHFSKFGVSKVYRTMNTCKDCLVETGRLRIEFDKEIYQRRPVPSAKKSKQMSSAGAVWGRAIRAAMKRDFKRNRNIDPANITMTYMLNLYMDQKGLCAVSGRRMTLGFAINKIIDKDALSVDRINSSKGYIKGNVRFVTYQVNTAKNRYTDADLLELCQDIVRTNEEGKAFKPKSDECYEELILKAPTAI